MREILAVVTRHIIIGLLFFLPRGRRLGIERWLRGKEEFRKLEAADWVLMSWAKSGRTWFRVMLSHCYQIKHGLPLNRMLEFDNLYHKNSAIPKVLFSHNNYLRAYLGAWDTLDHFRGKKVVMLVRDPRDVAVSQYFQWKFRMRPHKIMLNNYPPKGGDTSIWEFISSPDVGIPRIIEFFNSWARALPELEDILIIHYEVMRKDPQAVMQQVLEFTGNPGNDEQIAQAVEFSSLENMKKLEEKSVFRGSGVRVKAGDRNNPDSFKVRRGKVGGYRDYFDAAQVAEIDAMMAQLDPVFGYGSGDNGDSVPMVGSSAG